MFAAMSEVTVAVHELTSWPRHKIARTGAWTSSSSGSTGPFVAVIPDQLHTL